jgi:RND family efflux transporter MFP subunit
MRQLLKVALVIGIVALLVLGWDLYSGYRNHQQLKASTEAQAAVAVVTTKPQRQSKGVDLVLPGTLQANVEAPIYARTSGYLKRWLVDIGTPVKAGQLLAEIETPEVDQQLRQLQADLVTAQANQKIADVTAERWRNLRNTDSVSKQEADEKISQAASTDAQVNSAQANVQRVRELAGFQRIFAPFNGIVTARNTDVGQLINAGNSSGQELFRVADTTRLRLYVRVPQTYSAAMRPGLPAKLRLPDHPDKEYLATLDNTSSAIDVASRTLLVQLIVDNSNNELLPGAYTEVHFDLPAATGGGYYKLPSNVLLFRGDGLNVATVDAHHQVVMKPVTVGRDFGSEIEIVQGLSEDDNVVLSPPDSLTGGTSVRVVNPPPQQPAREVAKS